MIKTNPAAFCLLFIIAIRAQRTDKFNRHGLRPGEAFIGDFDDCGMTEQKYRTAKCQLQRWGFATFKATNKGTIATLADTRVFDINIERSNDQGNDQPTSSQRTGNDQITTTNNFEEGKNGKIEKAFNFERAPSKSEGGPRLKGSKVKALSRERENELIHQCRELFEPVIMEQYGANWRLRAREDPQLLERVLAEVESMIKEGKPMQSVGATANDLWERWSNSR